MVEDPDDAARSGGGLGPLNDPRPPRRRTSRRRSTVLLAAASVLLAVATAGLVWGLLDRRAERDLRDAAAQRRAVAAEIVRLRRVQAPHRGAARGLRPRAGASDAELFAARKGLLDAVRHSILGDARRRERRGELEGPVVAVTCGTILRDPKAVPDHLLLDRPVGRYDCLAVQRRGVGGTAVGHPFVAALDFRRYRYTWCRNTPPPSEAGKALAFVRLERACLAARGRAVGTGYVQTPEQKLGR